MAKSLTLAQIRVVEALARRGRISDASADLGITQPSVTKQLATVETRFRQRLFLRNGRKLTPSELCETLLPRMRTVLALAEEVEAALEGARGLQEGRVRIGYSTHQFVMHVLGAFMDSFRGIKIEARCMASFDLLAQLRDGKLDAAFVTLPGQEAGLDMLELRREVLVLMTRPSHPLALQDSVSLRDLAGLPLIQREGSSGTRRALEAVAVQQGVHLHTALDLGSWESMRAAVLADIGVGVVMAGEIGTDAEMRAIPIETGKGKPLSVGHYLVCLSDARNLSAISALFDLSNRLLGDVTI